MALFKSILVDTKKMEIEKKTAAGGVTVGGKTKKINNIFKEGAKAGQTFAEN